MGKRKSSIKDSSSSRDKVKLKKSWMSPKNLTSSRSEKNSKSNTGRLNSGKLKSKNSSLLGKEDADWSKNIDIKFPNVKKVLKDKQTLRQLLQNATPKKIQLKSKQKSSTKEIDTKNSVLSKPTSRRKSSKKEKQILGLMAGLVSKKEKEPKHTKLNLSKISKDSSQRESKTPLSTKSKREKSASKRGTSRLLLPESSKQKGKQFQLK